MIDLFTSPTPNGYKVSCTLEYLNIPYQAHLINLLEGEQFKKSFLKHSPNGKIPAIYHREEKLSLAESGAILIYLADMSGKLLPPDGPERFKVIEWLMFQMGHIGPMMGQSNVFFRYFPEKIDSVIKRYHKECRRLFEVVDNRLKNREWLADDFSIADIANWCWIRTYKWSGIEVEDLDHLQAWLEKIKKMPKIQKGLDVPVSRDILKQSSEKDLIKFSKRILTK